MSVIRRHPVITFFLFSPTPSAGAPFLGKASSPRASLVAALIVVSLTEGVAGLKAMDRG